MRHALKESIGSVLLETVRYPKGSIIVCTSCAKPIYKLERGIAAGEKAGRAASAFKPVSVYDLMDLQWRSQGGTEPGLVAAMREWTGEQMKAHADRLTAPKAGDPMLCPACGEVFVQSRSSESSDTKDRAYVLELLTVPPRAA